MQRKSFILVVAIVLVLTAIGGGVWWLTNHPEVTKQSTTNVVRSADLAATLAYQQGDVTVKVGDGDWLAVETDTVLHQGDSLKTGLESKAIVELENGDIVRLGYTSEVFFTSLKTDSVIITQTSGASYNRVAKNQSRVYEVKTDSATIQALGTAFDVVKDADSVDVTVVESQVKVITEKEQEAVAEGKLAIVDPTKQEVEVEEVDKSDLTNDWYTWNKEEDSKKTDKLGILAEYAGPAVTITQPVSGATSDTGSVTVIGTVSDITAKITVNGESVENLAGQFSVPVTLAAGKNIITVVAEDTEGHKTIKEVKVTYQVAAAATPLKLEAGTEDDGVHLAWNPSTSAGFQFYKVVKSETNADLAYPADGYIAKLAIGTERYTDTDVSTDKTYYYRVCEVVAGDQVFCSNVVHMKGKTVTEEDTDTEDTEADTLTLTASAEDDGIHFEWAVKGLTIEKGFKLVKGSAANPVFPTNDAQYLSDSKSRSYTWAITDGETYHFRICQYNGSGGCVVYSNDVTVKAHEGAVQAANVILSAKAEESGVGLWWTDASEIAGFKYYKVVRSETNANLKYPDDGYIVAKSKGEESHRDYSAVKGKRYFYRVCAVGTATSCSNVVEVTAINENAAPTAVTLQGSISAGTVTLTWTASAEKDFKYFKVVWSQTKPAPVYPADGYIKAIGGANDITATDDGSKMGSRTAAVDLSAGAHYYSVCVVDQADQVACSNSVYVLNGVVQ